MSTKANILWVEDSARFELASVLGPFYASRRYDLTLAENASAASEYLARRRFDALIVDIRLPPGPIPFWRRLHENAGSDRTNAKLGLELLNWLFNGTKVKESPDRPSWEVTPKQVGVFSVENRLEVGGELESLGVSVVHEKRPGLPDTILLEIVHQVLDQVA